MACPPFNKYFNASPNSRAAAITFDDGPGPWTEDVLDVLRANNAVASFCVVGERADDRRSLLKRMRNEGHEIVNHSWTHGHLVNMTNAQIKTELNHTNKLIKLVTGKTPCLFRPPYGQLDDRVVFLASFGKMAVVKWSLVANLYPDPPETTQDIIDKTELASAGDILLYHDGGHDPDGVWFDRTNLVEALPDVISILRDDKGLSLMTLSQMLSTYPPKQHHPSSVTDPCDQS